MRTWKSEGADAGVSCRNFQKVVNSSFTVATVLYTSFTWWRPIVLISLPSYSKSIILDESGEAPKMER